jgi:hypothetical protein
VILPRLFSFYVIRKLAIASRSPFVCRPAADFIFSKMVIDNARLFRELKLENVKPA